MRDPLFQGSARDQGGSLERLHRPNRFRVGYLSLKGGVGIHVRTGVDPGYLNAGLNEASEGIYPGRGQRKLAVGKFRISLDKSRADW